MTRKVVAARQLGKWVQRSRYESYVEFWTLKLECGHQAIRYASRVRGDGPPKRVRCDKCKTDAQAPYNPPILAPRQLGLPETPCKCGHPQWRHWSGTLEIDPVLGGRCHGELFGDECPCAAFDAPAPQLPPLDGMGAQR